MPHKFDFDLTYESRFNYRTKFLQCICVNFVVTNIEFLMSAICILAFLDVSQINLKTPALFFAVVAILASIVLYPTGLGLLWLFYAKGHAWKSKGVCVGFQHAVNYKNCKRADESVDLDGIGQGIPLMQRTQEDTVNRDEVAKMTSC